MPSNPSLLKSTLFKDEQAIDLYFNYASCGLFYFFLKNRDTAYADNRFSSFLNLRLDINHFECNQFFDRFSLDRLKHISNQKEGEESPKKGFNLYCTVQEKKYELQCQSYHIPSEELVLIAIESTKLSASVDSKQILKTKEPSLYESVLKNTKDAVLITEAEPFDKPGPRIVFANRAFCDMTGYTEEELIGETPRILQGPKTDRALLDKVRASLENWESCEYDLINYKKNGDEFWVNMSLTPLADENGWYTHWIAIERDITEDKKAEAKLASSERQYRQLIENLNDIVYSITDEGYFTFVSPAWVKLLGHRPEEVVGTSFTEYVHEEDIPLCAAFLDKVLKTGERQEGVEYRVKHKNGHWVWHTSSATPTTDNNGVVRGFDGLARDITESKMLQQQLVEAKEKAIESEQRLKLALISAQFGVWEWNILENEFIWDDKSSELFGFSKKSQKITLQEWSNCLDSRDREKVLADLQKALKDSNEFRATYRVRSAKGREIFLNGHGRIIRNEDNQALRVIGLVRDVTVEKNKQLKQLKAEKDKLQESEQRFKLATESAQLGIWEWNVQSNAVFWDERMYEIFGKDKKSEQPSYELWFDSIHAEDRDEVISELTKVLRRR